MTTESHQDRETIDPARLEEFSQIDGGTGTLIRTVLDAFMVSGSNTLDTLERAIAAGDDATIRSQLHCLKGACASLGLQKMSALLRDVRSREPDGLPANLPDLLAALRELHGQIREL